MSKLTCLAPETIIGARQFGSPDEWRLNGCLDPGKEAS